MIHSILFMIRTVQSPQLYILWPEDGPVQRSKHVVSLNKDKHKVVVLWFKRTPYLIVNKTTGMMRLKTVNTNQGHIHEYENTKV